jgi:short-subunit dehydrogenase
MRANVKLKPIDQQVMVIVGASSGIGLATARLAARSGAKVVLAARNADGLKQIEEEINGRGGSAVSIVADVTKREDLERVSQAAINHFGGFDTWFNNAGIGIYGTVEETNIDDARHMFDINFWGEVYGCLVALKHLKQRAGAIINMGSLESDRALPLNSFYAASKHAVLAFTDALRMELEHQGVPISLTTIKPAGINTPFPQHARNFMAREPQLPPPVYDPQVVARAVIRAATKPQRDVIVGGGGKMISSMAKHAPRLTDRCMERTMFEQQQSEEPARSDRRDALWDASQGVREQGDYPGHVMKSSMYTSAKQHPLITGAILGAAGVAIAGAIGLATAEE